MTPRRLVAAALAIIPWLVAPGLVQPDTKTDLTISPWRYLARALFAWNDHAGLGELQNQAYGYLFPYGPFMAVLHSAGVPAWAAQRAWWSVLLVVGFVGAERLMRRITPGGVAPEPAILVASVAFALSPRVLTVLANISVEAWPGALAPWLVLAAVQLGDRSSAPREVWRAVAVTGLLTAGLGGINATASALALVPAFSWLVTARRPSWRRLSLWSGAVLCGAAWWVLPLLVLGRYSYPFLDYIETARMTTAVTSLPNVLRGASHWIGYLLDSRSHPVWQAGWVQAQYVTAILSGCAVAGLGLGGLVVMARRTGAGRPARFAIVSTLVGVLMMSLGYAAVVGSPFAGPVRHFLDGAGAPLRNVHKADPLVRLPLAIGLAVALGRLAETKVGQRWLAVALAAVIAMPTAVWVGRVGDPHAYRSVPEAWREMARTVDARARVDGGSTLILPAARTATFTWGTMTDEPLTALATSPVVYRAAAPLGIGSATRILDAADLLAASGEPQPTLAAGLARLGVARVVVRHDVAASVQAESAAKVEATLRASPGFTELTTYGDLSLWRVADPAAALTSYPQSGEVVVRGGPESLFDVDPGRDTWLEVDLAAKDPQVVTDSARWRTYNNGVPAQLAYSATLTAHDRSPTRIGRRDLPPATSVRHQPTRVVVGASSVDVSSQQVESAATGWPAAIDGDPSTAWLSGSVHDARLTVRFDRPTRPGRVRIVLAAGGAVYTPRMIRIDGRRVAVRHGIADTTIAKGVRSLRIALPGPGGEVTMGIADLRLGGVELGTRIELPGRIDPTHATVLLTREQEDAAATLDRELTWSRTGRMQVSATLRVTSAGRLSARCGAAGVAVVGGTTVLLRATPSRTSSTGLRAGSVVGAVGCGAVHVGAGRTVITATGDSGSLGDAHGGRLQVATVRLSPDGTGASTGGSSSGRTVVVTSNAPGRLAARVGRGGATVLALTQGANAGWRAATRDGRTLSPVTVDGWRQGFVLPAGVATTVTIEFAPTVWHRAGLAVGALAVLGLLILLVLTRARGPSRRRGPPNQPSPATPQSPRPRSAAVVTVCLAGCLAGGWGLLVGAATLAVPRRSAPLATVAATSASGVALAGFGVVDHQSLGATAGQLLALVAVSLLVRELVDPWLRSGTAPSSSPVAPPSAATPPPGPH